MKWNELDQLWINRKGLARIMLFSYCNRISEVLQLLLETSQETMTMQQLCWETIWWLSIEVPFPKIVVKTEIGVYRHTWRRNLAPPISPFVSLKASGLRNEKGVMIPISHNSSKQLISTCKFPSTWWSTWLITSIQKI